MTNYGRSELLHQDHSSREGQSNISEVFDSNRKPNFFSELSSQIRRKAVKAGLSNTERAEKKLNYSKRIEELKKNDIKIAQLDDEDELETILRPHETLISFKKFKTTQNIDLPVVPEIKLEGIVARRVDDSIEFEADGSAVQPDLLARHPVRKLSRSVTQLSGQRPNGRPATLETNEFKKLKLTQTTFGLESLTIKKQMEKEKYKEFITQVALEAKAANGQLEPVPDNNIFFYVVDEEFSKEHNPPVQSPPQSMVLKPQPQNPFSIDRKLAEYNGFFVNNVFELSAVNWTAQGIDLKEDTSKDDNAVFRRVDDC